jgi:hypothetical protein
MVMTFTVTAGMLFTVQVEEDVTGIICWNKLGFKGVDLAEYRLYCEAQSSNRNLAPARFFKQKPTGFNQLGISF